MGASTKEIRPADGRDGNSPEEIRAAKTEEDKLYNEETLSLYKYFYDRRLVDVEDYLRVKKEITRRNRR